MGVSRSEDGPFKTNTHSSSTIVVELGEASDVVGGSSVVARVLEEREFRFEQRI
jgi:hypothetical protein